MVIKWKINVWSKSHVSFIKPFETFFSINCKKLKYYFECFCKQDHARSHLSSFYQKLGRKLIPVVSKQNKFRGRRQPVNWVGTNEHRKKFVIVETNKISQDPDIIHNNSCNILLSGDVERNPGPGPGLDPREEQTNGNDDGTNRGNRGKTTPRAKDEVMEIITYNCRGLKEYKKLKRILNTCDSLMKRNKDSIVLIQETHLNQAELEKIKIMWRGSYNASPGEGASK